jgi:hypothetical protein
VGLTATPRSEGVCVFAWDIKLVCLFARCTPSHQTCRACCPQEPATEGDEANESNLPDKMTLLVKLLMLTQAVTNELQATLG